MGGTDVVKLLVVLVCRLVKVAVVPVLLVGVVRETGVLLLDGIVE